MLWLGYGVVSGSSKLLSLAPVAREVAAEWGLELGARFDRASYSYVVIVGEDTVLKVVPPDAMFSNFPQKLLLVHLWQL